MRVRGLAWILVAACVADPAADDADDPGPIVPGDTEPSDTDTDAPAMETDDDTDVAPPEPDADHDGAPDASDCDDTDPDIRPGAPESCDAVDRDCDGDPVAGAEDARAWYLDADGDGFGGGVPLTACGPVPDRTVVGGDCNDFRAHVHPGASEVCDGLDNDCAGPWSAADEAGLVTFTDPTGTLTDLSATFRGDLALTSGTYRICSGRWDVSLTADHVDVELFGLDGAVLDGAHTRRLLDVRGGSLAIDGLTLEDGFVEDDGGLLRAEDAAIELRGALLQDGIAQGSGGAVAIRGGSLQTTGGGCLGNQADGSGGAIDAVDADLTLDWYSLSANLAGVHGGGIALAGGDLTLTHSNLFANRTAAGDGGAIRIERPDDPIWIATSNFSRNEGYNGGALAVVDATVHVQSGLFVYGSAAVCGGAIHALASTLSVVDTQVDANEAASGGGVCVRDAVSTELAGDTWTANAATGVGPDEGHGGAVRAEGGGRLTLDLNLDGNRARYGGAIALRASPASPDVAELASVDLTDNSAVVDGGALHLDGVSAHLTWATWAKRNEAGGRGGGVWISGDPTDAEVVLTMDRGSSVQDGAAPTGGGVWVGPNARVVCGDDGLTAIHGIPLPAITGNLTTAQLSGAVDLSDTSSRFEARRCDLGDRGTASDNLRSVGSPSTDVWVGRARTWVALGADATTTCDGSGCTP